MEIVLLLLVSAFLCGFVADSKGRNGIGWFVLGLLLPIISLLALIALPALSKGDKPASAGQWQAQDGREFRPCPDCAEPIRRAAVKCRFCGWTAAPTAEPRKA
jgi:hypothetical protein